MDVIDELLTVVGERDEAIHQVLVKLEAELERCRERCAELEEASHRARALLNPRAAGGAVVPERRMTLHEAMQTVLADAGPDGLTGPELRDAVLARHLYVGRKGQPASINQIHARARNYPHLFRVDGGRFRLP